MRAGFGVFIVIAAGAVLLWAALSIKHSTRRAFGLHFTAEQGVYGIKIGSPVRVGGLDRGLVTGVAPRFEGEEIAGYRVDFELEEDVPLYRSARIQASGGPLAGDSVLEIIDVGRGPNLPGPQPLVNRSVRPAEPGDTFDAVNPAEFDSLVGPGNSSRLRDLVQAFADLKGPITAMAEDGPVRVTGFRTEWRGLMDAVLQDVDAWREQWKQLAADAEHAVAKLGAAEGAPADAVVPALRSLRDDMSTIDLQANAARAKALGASLSGAVGTLDSIQAQVFAFRNAVDDAYSGLGLAAADFALAGQQLSATEKEVIAAPWKLFGSPSAMQIARSNRVDEARMFAQAATEYEAAVAAIRQSLADDSAMLVRTPGLAELLSNRLGAASAAFDAAMQRFADALLEP